jgi:hypothetical protein
MYTRVTWWAPNNYFDSLEVTFAEHNSDRDSSYIFSYFRPDVALVRKIVKSDDDLSPEENTSRQTVAVGDNFEPEVKTKLVHRVKCQHFGAIVALARPGADQMMPVNLQEERYDVAPSRNILGLGNIRSTRFGDINKYLNEKIVCIDRFEIDDDSVSASHLFIVPVSKKNNYISCIVQGIKAAQDAGYSTIIINKIDDVVNVNVDLAELIDQVCIELTGAE